MTTNNISLFWPRVGIPHPWDAGKRFSLLSSGKQETTRIPVDNTLTLGSMFSSSLSLSPCSKNSVATSSAIWTDRAHQFGEGAASWGGKNRNTNQAETVCVERECLDTISMHYTKQSEATERERALSCIYRVWSPKRSRSPCKEATVKVVIFQKRLELQTKHH